MRQLRKYGGRSIDLETPGPTPRTCACTCAGGGPLDPRWIESIILEEVGLEIRLDLENERSVSMLLKRQTDDKTRIGPKKNHQPLIQVLHLVA